MAKRRRARFIVFFAIVLGALALVVAMRRGPRRGPGAERAAGVGSSGGDEPGVLVEDARRYAVKTWSFPLERWQLRIEDVALTTALDGVLAKTNAELVVNGGFFDPDGKPVGLAMSNGAVLSRLSKTSAGGVLTIDADGENGPPRASLFPAETFALPDSGALFGIQCKPRLVVNGAVNVKGDDGKRAERTALCLRDAGRTIDVAVIRGSEDGESPGPSLFALARYLSRSGCESALNLDGGPSTGVAWREDGGTKLLAPRAPIRHALVFRAKE